MSIVIPAYNEEVLIEKSIGTVVDHLEEKPLNYEIIVVCDGCDDNTPSIVNRIARNNARIILINNQANMGKGFSVRKGCLNAKGDYIFFTDADLSTPIDEISKLLKCLQEGYDIAIGSRAFKESDIQIRQSWYRESMGKIFNVFVQTFVLKGIKDTQCGFKGFKKEAVKNIFLVQTINGFGFDVEVLYIAQKFGYKLKNIPIKWLNRAESRVNPLTHSLEMLLDLVRIRLRHGRKNYRQVRSCE